MDDTKTLNKYLGSIYSLYNDNMIVNTPYTKLLLKL